MPAAPGRCAVIVHAFLPDFLHPVLYLLVSSPPSPAVTFFYCCVFPGLPFPVPLLPMPYSHCDSFCLYSQLCGVSPHLLPFCLPGSCSLCHMVSLPVLLVLLQTPIFLFFCPPRSLYHLLISPGLAVVVLCPSTFLPFPPAFRPHYPHSCLPLVSSGCSGPLAFSFCACSDPSLLFCHLACLPALLHATACLPSPWTPQVYLHGHLHCPCPTPSLTPLQEDLHFLPCLPCLPPFTSRRRRLPTALPVTVEMATCLMLVWEDCFPTPTLTPGRRMPALLDLRPACETFPFSRSVSPPCSSGGGREEEERGYSMFPACPPLPDSVMHPSYHPSPFPGPGGGGAGSPMPWHVCAVCLPCLPTTTSLGGGEDLPCGRNPTLPVPFPSLTQHCHPTYLPANMTLLFPSWLW